MLIMTVGSLLYAVGFSMYGYVSAYSLFMLAMVIITIGEMLKAPTGQALVAAFSPVDMRGRYMAIYGFTWTIPAAIGPLGAGLIMDNFDPRLVWYAAGLVLILSAVIFAFLHLRAGDRIQEMHEAQETDQPVTADAPTPLSD
jgi:MFS family permease